MMGRIRISETTVFDGTIGWIHGGVRHRLAVGGNLAQAPNGDLLCTWMSGSDSEPAGDNCVLMARSADGGATWGSPRMWIPAGDFCGAGSVVPFPMPDGRLVAFAAGWPVAGTYTVWHYRRLVSRNHGRQWQDTGELVLSEERDVSLMTPIRMPGGGFLFPAGTYRKRAKPLGGSVADLLSCRTEEEAMQVSADPGQPVPQEQPGQPGRLDPGKFATHLHGCRVYGASADMTRFERLGDVANRPLGLLEPTLVRLDDGRLVMLMRAEFGGCLWRSDSLDGGRTWSEAVPTDIPNPSSLACLVRLPDGRIALLHNPCGYPGAMTIRDPLSLWISDDGMESWTIQEDLLTGGWLSYPSALICQDGTLVFGYDRDRRQVRFVRVDLGA